MKTVKIYSGTPTKINSVADVTVVFMQTLAGVGSFQLTVINTSGITGNYTFSYSIISSPNVI